MKNRRTADPAPGKGASGRKIRRDHTRQKLAVFGILLAALLLVAAFSTYLCPYDPYAQDLSVSSQAPGAAHLLGTDQFGRDMLSRVIAGSRTSIYSAVAVVAAVTVTGTAVGLFCGYMGGWIDTVLMRISDIFLAFPGLVFALAVAGVLGGGIWSAVIALAAIGWPKYARIARSETLAQKEQTYLMAAKLSGCSAGKLIFRHILPNIAGQILVTAVLDVGTMMMEIAGLSFLGLGAKPPMAEWGSMMSDGRSMLQTTPWVILAPGAAIFISVAIFNLFGDTLRDYLDPKRVRDQGHEGE